MEKFSTDKVMQTSENTPFLQTYFLANLATTGAIAPAATLTHTAGATTGNRAGASTVITGVTAATRLAAA
ncbi:hypothetical protein SLA2020_048500 [Shorea laevis]